jgi:hypothetical protein
MTKLLFYAGTILMCSASVAPTAVAQEDDFEITLEVLDDVSEIEGVILSLEDALEIEVNGSALDSVSDTADSETAADSAFDDELESAEEDDDRVDLDLDDEIDSELEDGDQEQFESDLEEDPETELDE